MPDGKGGFSKFFTLSKTFPNAKETGPLMFAYGR
jgi:hypothetical protein